MSAASPLLEFFQRGEVARDVKLLAAQGGFAPRADEQLGILVHLLDDPDPEIRQTADDTLNNIPVAALSGFLARPDISLDLREFFADRGIFPDEDVVIDFDKALVDNGEPDDLEIEREGLDQESVIQKLQKMSFPQRLKAAVKGSKEIRMIARNRVWLKNYKVALRLCKNPKTPVAISMNLLQRIMPKDLSLMATDRNIPEPLRVAARKKVITNRT